MALQAIAATAAVVGTGYSIYSGEKARKANKKASTQARADADTAARQAEQIDTTTSHVGFRCIVRQPAG